MNTTPTVTVVIPAFEAGEDVRAALDSVLDQTLEDFEVLVVDDGSVHAPVPEDLPEDPRIEVIRRPHNAGFAEVTNLAYPRARGRWVVSVDADDAIAPTYLETMVAAGERYDAQTVFAPLQCVRDGRHIGTLWWNSPGPVSDSREAMRRLLRNDIAGSQHVLFRTPTAPSPTGVTYSDWVFLLRHVSGTDRAAYVEEPLYRYTISPGSTSGGLRPNVWELAEIPDMVRPLIEQTFPPDEAAVLVADVERLGITQMLHKAARERVDSALRREVTRWCRARITPRDVIELFRHGHRVTAASWALAKASPALHRRAYQTYDAFKGWRSQVSIEPDLAVPTVPETGGPQPVARPSSS